MAKWNCFECLDFGEHVSYVLPWRVSKPVRIIDKFHSKIFVVVT